MSVKIDSINPANGKLNGSFEVLSKSRAIKIAADVKTSAGAWKGLKIKEREEYLKALATVLNTKKKEYAKLMTLEMGKPITQSVSEVEKCAWTAEYFASMAEKWLADETVDLGDKKAIVTFEPIGTVLAVMPWNFPFWQALRCAIPAMAAGNTCLLRHSNVVPMSAMAIEDAFKSAGFPKNTFRTIITDHQTVTELIDTDYVDGVSVTGSIETGKKIAIAAAAKVKKCVLELGGSDPFIVLNDADIEFTCKGAVNGRLVNGGQSCVAAKRFIVVKEKYDEFIEKFSSFMSEQVVGDPMDENTQLGPLANEQQFVKLVDQVKDATKKGARVAVGGKRVGTSGFFFEPTLLTDIKPGMKVYTEEVFGPVASVIKVGNEEEALKVANGTRFGLGSSVWTRDISRGLSIARKIEAGIAFVNDTVKSDPRIPFGGIKESGIGRELSRYGLLEFTNIKPIVGRFGL